MKKFYIKKFEIKKYLNSQTFLIVFVNLFLANMLPHGMISFITYMFFFLSRLQSSLSFNIASIAFDFLCLTMLLRLIWLPILYTYLEKESKIDYIQKFIFNLKNKRDFRIKVLVILEMPVLLYDLYYLFLSTDLYDLFCNFIIASFASIVSIIMCDLFGSYLVLFLWWKFKGELK